MLKKKILGIAALGAGILLLSGCGGNNPASQNIDTQKSTGIESSNSQESTSENAVDTSKFPKPTGKVDDTVNAIMDEANQEKTEATSDDNDAKAAVNDSQEANDLNNSINPNEIQ